MIDPAGRVGIYRKQCEMTSCGSGRVAADEDVSGMNHSFGNQHDLQCWRLFIRLLPSRAQLEKSQQALKGVILIDNERNRCNLTHSVKCGHDETQK